jgi:hypothetical protein
MKLEKKWDKAQKLRALVVELTLAARKNSVLDIHPEYVISCRQKSMTRKLHIFMDTTKGKSNG